MKNNLGKSLHRDLGWDSMKVLCMTRDVTPILIWSDYNSQTVEVIKGVLHKESLQKWLRRSREE